MSWIPSLRRISCDSARPGQPSPAPHPARARIARDRPSQRPASRPGCGSERLRSHRRCDGSRRGERASRVLAFRCDPAGRFAVDDTAGIGFGADSAETPATRPPTLPRRTLDHRHTAPPLAEPFEESLAGGEAVGTLGQPATTLRRQNDAAGRRRVRADSVDLASESTRTPPPRPALPWTRGSPSSGTSLMRSPPIGWPTPRPRPAGPRPA